jgi:hypothetical protein
MSDTDKPDSPAKDAGAGDAAKIEAAREAAGKDASFAGAAATSGEASGSTGQAGKPASGGKAEPWKDAAAKAAGIIPPPPTNSYMAGFFLGLTLLASYLILGTGLGASGAFARLAAYAEHSLLPARVEASAYFGQWFPGPLSYYLVFMAVGIFLGGVFSAASGRRVNVQVERGPTASRIRRLFLALTGGVLAGFASRLAQGCTSGQGLSGGALLLTGSFIFMGCLFATGYLTAWAFRRQWK